MKFSGRKIIALLLSMAMTAAFAGCGKSDSTPDEVSSASAAEETTASAPANEWDSWIRLQ